MNNTRARRLIQLATSSSQHPHQQLLNEATGQWCGDEILQQCDTSSEEVPYEEVSSSDSDYVPEESIDFLSNTLEESTSSNEEVLDEETGVLSRKGTHKKKRSRKGQADPTKWKRFRNSKARLQGKQYEGFEKDRNGKYNQTLLRPAKNLQERCGGHTEVKHGGPKQRFECETLSEEDRKLIFDSYWALSSREARKVYVRGLVSVYAPQHRRSLSVDSRKDKAFKYLMDVEWLEEEVPSPLRVQFLEPSSSNPLLPDTESPAPATHILPNQTEVTSPREERPPVHLTLPTQRSTSHRQRRRDERVPRWAYDLEEKRIAVEERLTSAIETLVDVISQIRDKYEIL